MPKRMAEDDCASTLSCYTPASNVSRTQAQGIDISRYRPVKQRKTVGLNTRYDRMIKSVNALLSHSPTVSRKRIKSESSGTSSVSSHDPPKTPVDAYSTLHPVKLGKDFSVLKMKKSPLLPRGGSDAHKPVAPPRGSRSPLPDWLASTFTSLEPDHPLRGLVSSSHFNSESKSESPVKLPYVSHEEEIFAFSPFEFDEQEALPHVAYHTDNTLTKQAEVSSIIPKEPSHRGLELKGATGVLPFSTPGCFAPIRRSRQDPIIGGTFREPLLPVPQQTAFHATNMMHPPALPASHLRPNDEIEQPQFNRTFSNLTQDNDSSDFQDHDAHHIHNFHRSRSGESHLNVYATPGPTFACSRPVYFDSPTEDPSLSDPLQPESYELDLNAVDFRWRPFLRLNARESDKNGNSASPLAPPGYAVPNPRACDQSGWCTRFSVDQGDHGASTEEPPFLAAETEMTYLGDGDAVLPSNATTTTEWISFNNPIGPSMITDAQQARAASPIPSGLLSPLRNFSEKPALLAVEAVLPRVFEENIHTSKEHLPLIGRGVIALESYGARLSTPIRQVPVSPPSAPQKARPSQRHGMRGAPVRRTASALSWMMPLKFSKRTAVAHDDAGSRFLRVTPGSRDSIESWSETSGR